MEKFISFQKLSKKKQRELNAKKRGSWHGLNPVTRRPDNSKAYNRQKARKWSDDSMTVPFVSFIYCAGADGCTPYALLGKIALRQTFTELPHLFCGWSMAITPLSPA